MKLDIPDVFIDLVKGLGAPVNPNHVINALSWASEHPERAIEVVEDWKILKSYGKDEFQTWLSLGLEPDRALECARDYETRQCEKSSFLRKVIAGAKRGSYQLTLPNGVTCTVELRGEGDYWFKFNPGGEEVYLIYSGQKLSYVVNSLRKEGIVVHHGLLMIVYGGKGYDPDSPVGKVIEKAVEQNVNPKVLAVVGA